MSEDNFPPVGANPIQLDSAIIRQAPGLALPLPDFSKLAGACKGEGGWGAVRKGGRSVVDSKKEIAGDRAPRVLYTAGPGEGCYIVVPM